MIPLKTKKADYGKIASFYDKGRSLSEENTELWLGLTAELSGAPSGTKLLDLGCGTGRFSVPFACRLGYDVTGVDISSAMLKRARRKDPDGRVKWITTDAGSLRVPSGSFGIVFMSHLLHHVDSPPAVLRECFRVLGVSGVVLVRYGAIEQIRSDVEHTFFPGVLEIDEARTPSAAAVEEWLAGAGFRDITSREAVQRTYISGAAHLEAARRRSTSVLTLIPRKDFRAGIRRLTEHVRLHPGDDRLLYDRMTMTVGRKPAGVIPPD